MNKFVFLSIIILAIACKQDGLRLDLGYFKITVPESFEILETSADELIKLNYKNQFYLVMQDNVNKSLNLSDEQLKEFDRSIHMLRFQRVRANYQGYYVDQPRNWSIDGNEITSQEFVGKTGDVEVYYDYSILKVDKRYIEILVTGKKEDRRAHIPIINELLTSIRKN